ncbi:MAG TPA: hypothetical protein VFF68_09135 [Anaerolineaceae bacterium]|nr:hypothetical protein [Anaerolineaceae bacterium]
MAKHTPFILVSLALLWTLAACSGAPSAGANPPADPPSAATTAGSSPSPDSAPAGLPDQPIEQKLAFGTLLLEGTGQAVTPEQAAALLPLWKAVKSLSTSDIASPEEIAALYAQIQEGMTTEQLETIQALELAADDLQSLMEAYDIQLPQFNRGDLSDEEIATRVAERMAQGGGLGPGGGMGAIPAEAAGRFTQGDPSAIQNLQITPGALGEGRGIGAGRNNLWVEPLIELLEERAAQ